MTSKTAPDTAPSANGRLKGDPEKRRRQAAKVLGIPEDKVDAHHFQLSFLKERCALVDVYVGGESLFTVRASNAEMNWVDDSARAEWITAGTKNLIPDEFVNRRRSRAERARNWTRKHGLAVSALGGYIPVPFGQWADWLAGWERFLAEDAADVEAIIAGIPKWKKDFIPDKFARIGAEAWDSLRDKRARKGQKLQGVKVGGVWYTSKESFVQFVVRDALNRLPDEATIRTRCVMSYQVSVLSTGADLKAELAKEEAKAAEIAKAQAEIEVAKSKARSEAELAALKVREERIAQDIRLNAMRQESLAQAAEQIKAAGNPLAEAIQSMMGKVAAQVNSAFESYQNNGYIHGKQIAALGSLMELWRSASMGVVYEDLEAKIAALQTAVADTSNPDKTANIVQAIVNLQEALAVDADAELTAGRFKFLEV